VGYGTALGVIRSAVAQGKKVRVIATETRPRLQGARLTVYELKRDGVDVTLITDNMVGYVISQGMVDKVVVGADRVLRDGHVTNKIGTLTIAIVASRYSVPFYVAAPSSTFDLSSRAEDVVIEQRDPREVLEVNGRPITIDVAVLNPAFDITPPDLVTAIITEKGIIRPPYHENIPKTIAKATSV
jgi:methylthioribose-1-phosphate isomerase